MCSRDENIPDLFLAWPLGHGVGIWCVSPSSHSAFRHGVSVHLRADAEADPLLETRDIDPTQPVPLCKEFIRRCLEVFIWNNCVNCEMPGLERQECDKRI